MAGEYAVKVSVRNGLILRRMKALGIKSQTELAKLSGLSIMVVSDIITLRRAPRSKISGDWLDAAYALSSALQVEPEDLWTETQSQLELRRNNHEVYVGEEDLKRLSSDGGVERLVLEGERRKVITNTLTKLRPREEYVVRRRFFEDDRLEDIAKDMGLTRERVRQIEGKALRKLKHPSSGLEKYIREEKHERKYS